MAAKYKIKWIMNSTFIVNRPAYSGMNCFISGCKRLSRLTISHEPFESRTVELSKVHRTKATDSCGRVQKQNSINILDTFFMLSDIPVQPH